MEIRQLRQETITDAEADELARLRTLIDPRRAPSDPPILRQHAINELRGSTAAYGLNYWAMFDGDNMVGLGETAGALNGPNTDVSEIGIWIDPARLDATPSFDLHHTLFNHVDTFERSIGRVRYWGWGDKADPITRGFWEG